MSARVDLFHCYMTFLLLLCVCSLAGHFLAEGLLPSGDPACVFSTNAAHTHPGDEPGDDTLLAAVRSFVAVEGTPGRLSSPALNSAWAHSILPLLPPPNL